MMIELSVIRDFVAIFGVIAGFTYYVMTVRNAQRTRELTLKAQEEAIGTRQAQILMQLAQYSMSKDGWRDNLEWSNMEWNDYDDFENKYGSDVNPESYVLRSIRINYYNRVGLLVRHGLIDKNLAYDFAGTGFIQNWNKYGEIIKVQRELYNLPNYGIEWEYLYDEMVKIAKQRGHDTTSGYNISYTDEVKQKLDS